MMVNKYARMVETIIDDIFGFYIVNARNKSVFVFSVFKMAEKVYIKCWKCISYD
jgi:hypothetical protein